MIAVIATAAAAVATSRAMMTRISRQQLDEQQAPADDVIESRDLSAADIGSYSGLFRRLCSCNFPLIKYGERTSKAHLTFFTENWHTGNFCPGERSHQFWFSAPFSF